MRVRRTLTPGQKGTKKLIRRYDSQLVGARYRDDAERHLRFTPVAANHHASPLVAAHAGVFRDLFDHQCQFRHFQHDLTELIVLPNKSLANIARCILESADNTNLSRLLSEAPWREDTVNRRRIRFML